MSTLNGSPFLDRSPSLSSDSGASSASSLPPITPALGSVSSFTSASGREPLEVVNEFGSPPKTVFPRLAKSSGSSSNASTPPTSSRPGPWSKGHKTGAGSASFDAARAAFSNVENGRTSPVIRTTSFGEVKGRQSPSPTKDSPFRSASPSLSHQAPPSPTRTGSPTRFSRPPLPTIPSSSTFDSNSSSAQAPPSRPLSMSIGPQSARILSSAIFSSKDRPQSPIIGNGEGSPVLERGMGSMRRPDGRGHRRAMTLPQLGLNGLPVPGGDVGAEDVPGKSLCFLTKESL